MYFLEKIKFYAKNMNSAHSDHGFAIFSQFINADIGIVADSSETAEILNLSTEVWTSNVKYNLPVTFQRVNCGTFGVDRIVYCTAGTQLMKFMGTAEDPIWFQYQDPLPAAAMNKDGYLVALNRHRPI